MGRNIIPVVEKYTELELILEYCEKVGVRPQIGMRVKLAARGGGRWQGSGGYRSKFGLTVARDPERARRAEAARHAGLLQAAPLPPRQPDSQHPRRQARAERGGPHLHRAAQGRGRARVPGRRRRPGRRLRRQPDQLRVEHELHARGIRQRRRVPHPERVRRRGRAASDDHVGKRARGGGVSLGADLQRARGQRLRRQRRAQAAQSRRGRAAAGRPQRHVQQPHDAQRARGLSRRAAGAGHGAEPVQRRLPAARRSACRPRRSTGPSC